MNAPIIMTLFVNVIFLASSYTINVLAEVTSKVTREWPVTKNHQQDAHLFVRSCKIETRHQGLYMVTTQKWLRINICPKMTITQFQGTKINTGWVSMTQNQSAMETNKITLAAFVSSLSPLNKIFFYQKIRTN